MDHTLEGIQQKIIVISLEHNIKTKCTAGPETQSSLKSCNHVPTMIWPQEWRRFMPETHITGCANTDVDRFPTLGKDYI